jgi:hypothetical protein
MSGTNSNRPANTPTQQASEATNPPSFNAPTVEVQSWLPPKLIAPHLVQRWLPPRFNPSPASDVVWGSKNNSHTVRLPDGQGGFTTVDDRVTYIWVNGERIPVTVPDRAIRWRIRFLFNLVAMLVSILILYLAYLWISS